MRKWSYGFLPGEDPDYLAQPQMVQSIQGTSLDGMCDFRTGVYLDREQADALGCCFHGTQKEKLQSIIEHGVWAKQPDDKQRTGQSLKMAKTWRKEGSLKRVHAMFSPFASGNPRVANGMRHENDVDAHICVHMGIAYRTGCKLHMSWAGALQSRDSTPPLANVSAWVKRWYKQGREWLHAWECVWCAPERDPLCRTLIHRTLHHMEQMSGS